MALSPTMTNAAVMPNPTTGEPTSQTAKTAENQVMTARLETIKAMDKSTLGFSEKRQLRKEVRSIKHRLHVNNGGVYISIGTLLLVVILLIVLL